MRISKAPRGIGLATAVTVGLLLSTTGAALAATTPGWECVPTTAGQAVVSGGTGAAPSCSAGETAVLAPTYVSSGVGGKPTVQLSGVNLQVINGTGSETTINGTGNLVLGYDEKAGKQTGSHDLLLGGTTNSYTSYGGIIGGGHNNTASGPFASVLGGAENTASGTSSTVFGGYANKATANDSSIAGGCSNLTGKGTPTINTQCTNTALTGDFTSITGGTGNQAEAQNSAIAGGAYNLASGFGSSSGAGYHNTAKANYSSVSAGYYNLAEGELTLGDRRRGKPCGRPR